MKKTLGTVLLLLAVAGVLAAQNPSDDEYVKAMQVSDPCQKVAALKAWLGKYAGKGAQYENFANAYIALTPCKTTAAADVVQYGQKALALGGIDEATKFQLLSTMATVALNAGQTDQARDIAQQIVDLGKANRQSDAANSAQWTKVMGAGLYLQGQAAEKAKNYTAAADAYIQAYGVLRNPEIAAQLRKLGKTLYDQQQYAAAEKIFREFYAQAKDSESAVALGQVLYKSGKTDEALAVFKEAYAKKKTGDLAYNIGIMLAQQAKTNPAMVPEAVNFLLEAHFLAKGNTSVQSMNLAQSLFFTATKDVKYNELATKIQEDSKVLDDMTKAFNENYGGKDPEEMSGADKARMEKASKALEEQKAAIAKLEAEQKVYIDKFNALVAQVKGRLGR